MKAQVLGLLLLAVCIVVAAPAGAETPPGQGGSLRLAQPNAARFPLVTLYAHPVASGRYAGGLGPGSFRVTENGQPAQIVGVETEGGRLDIGLALDRSRSMETEGKLDYARGAARAFLQQLGPEDQAALVTFADGSTLEQPLTRDRSALLAAVDRTQPAGNTTTFLDGVFWAIAQVALQSPGGGVVVGTGPARAEARRVVVALTDGNDLSSRVLPQELLDYARANGVSLCMVALGEDAATAQMEYLARQTGGVFLRSPGPEDLQQLYADLAAQLRREYRVTIRSPHPERDGTRRLVRLEVPEHSLLGETWYQAPGQGSLLVTVTGRDGQGPGVVAGGPGARKGPKPQVILGTLLLLAGLTGALTALFLWWRTRGRTLPMADSNPRIDLLPLWVRQGSTRVGRGLECELVLDSQQVSRVHARIEAGMSGFRVIDEGSRNGTYVNGRRVRGSRDLRIGDVIRFGDREFRFAGVVS
jgi:Ca-activated chloride channel homolog